MDADRTLMDSRQGTGESRSAEPATAPTGGVVLLGSGGGSTHVLYHAICGRYPVAAVIVERPVARTILIRRRAARIGWLRALDQAAFAVALAPVLRLLARGRLRELDGRVSAAVPIPAHTVMRVPSVNDQACRALLDRLQPDVVVVSGTRIIDRAVIEGVPAPFINVHSGITPRYRGAHGAYWALTEGRPDFAGVTVHEIDAGIDTGRIIGQARITPTGADSIVTYPLLQLEAGIPLLLDAIAQALEGRLNGGPSLDDAPSRLWYHPGAVAYVVRRLAHGVR